MKPPRGVCPRMWGQGDPAERARPTGRTSLDTIETTVSEKNGLRPCGSKAEWHFSRGKYGGVFFIKNVALCSKL